MPRLKLLCAVLLILSLLMPLTALADDAIPTPVETAPAAQPAAAPAPAELARQTECEAVALQLSRLGLFRGGENGFELMRTPSRVEAAVMLIRLLGMEPAALSAEVSHPFTDVPLWADKHIAYLYHMGLTKGTSETTFDAASLCNARTYTTFILRALGYSDAEGDFTYETSLVYGGMYKLINTKFSERLAGQEFLRGDMAVLSFNALFLLRKGTEEVLLRKLQNDGAVVKDRAEALLNVHRSEQLLTDALTAFEGQTSAEVHTLEDVSLTRPNNPLKFKLDTVKKQSIENGSPVMYSREVATFDTGEKLEFETTIFNGYVYIKEGDGTKSKMSLAEYGKTRQSDSEEPVATSTDSGDAYSDIKTYEACEAITIRSENGNTIVERKLTAEASIDYAMMFVGIYITSADIPENDFVLAIEASEESTTFDAQGNLISLTRKIKFTYFDNTLSGPNTFELSATSAFSLPGAKVTFDLSGLSSY